MWEAKSHWRVLVVEDEAKVARALREGLEREKYEVVVAPTGEEGFFLVNMIVNWKVSLNSKHSCAA